MNRERGASSLILALLILILGSLLLQGVNQQQASYAARVTTQSLAIQRQALVQSALFLFRSKSLFAEIIGG